MLFELFLKILTDLTQFSAAHARPSVSITMEMSW
jgi:hypothetical protein